MEMDFSETKCLMTHYCGQPLKIDEIDILSWLTRLMGLPIKANCSFTDACSACPSLSSFQVDNAYTNPSRLTAIIRIRRADIWYELSLLPVQRSCLRETGNLGSRTTRQKSLLNPPKSHPQDKVFHLQIGGFIIYLFSGGRVAQKQWLLEAPALLFQRRHLLPINNLYLLKCCQPSAEGINIICYAGRKGKVCAWLCVHVLYVFFKSTCVVQNQRQLTGVYSRWLQASFPCCIIY